jgi:hypothetical protein
MTSYDKWSFDKFLDEIIHLSEIAEIPGVEEARKNLIRIMWGKFPNECKELGLKDFA